MFNLKETEKGQAIVLIALAIVALLGMTALAIDAGNGFSDRRKAQAAADNAALAGALAKITPSSVSYAVYTITGRNGFADETVNYADGGPFVDCKGNSLDPVNHSDPDDNASQYVQVTIRSQVDTFFGPIVGIPVLKNCVYSIARGEPSKPTEFLTGQAIAALDCHAKDAIKINGDAGVVVIGGGIFSNSDHPTDSIYIGDQSAIGLPKPPLSAVGKINGGGMTGEEGVEQLPCDMPDDMLPPEPPSSCDYTYANFPPHSSDANVTVPAHPTEADPIDIGPGVYCITNVMNNPDNMVGDDVTFVLMPGVGLSWSGNPSNIRLSAPMDPEDPFNHILFYAPKTNTGSLTFNGTAGMTIVGSIIAPTAQIKVTGTFGAESKSQWVARTVEIMGTFDGIITYNDQTKHVFIAPPSVQLTR